MNERMALQSFDGDVNSPGRILFGEVGHHPDVNEDRRRGYLIEVEGRETSQKGRIEAEAYEIFFSDAYDVLENGEFEEVQSDVAVSGGMYGEDFNLREVGEDLVGQIEKYGLEGGAEPAEGYEVTVANPE